MVEQSPDSVKSITANLSVAYGAHAAPAIRSIAYEAGTITTRAASRLSKRRAQRSSHCSKQYFQSIAFASNAKSTDNGERRRQEPTGSRLIPHSF